MHGRTSVFAALPLPRHAASAAADLVAARRALDGAVLSIEGARTHAHAIGTGDVPVFCAFRHAPQPFVWADAEPGSLEGQLRLVRTLPGKLMYIYIICELHNRYLPALRSLLA